MMSGHGSPRNAASKFALTLIIDAALDVPASSVGGRRDSPAAMTATVPRYAPAELISDRCESGPIVSRAASTSGTPGAATAVRPTGLTRLTRLPGLTSEPTGLTGLTRLTGPTGLTGLNRRVVLPAR